MAPRVVRRKPLRERISAWFNFMDMFLWLSEEMETREWDSASIGTKAGIGLNFLLLLSRANLSSDSYGDDDLFVDSSDTGWFKYLVTVVAWSLTIFSLVNAGYVFARSRSYRLFEFDIASKPDTPNASRVRVQSNPSAGSPFRLIANAMTSETAESRSHPDKTRDVWELAVWDPLPLSLRMFCLFSPGHVLVYTMFIPLVSLDPRPSVTVFNCLVLQVLLSVQLFALQTQYARQIKDHAIVQKEVMREYDSKLVHPRQHHVVRDVGTQFAQTRDGRRVEYISVGTPTTQINVGRTFETHPNPNYAKHYDPDNYGARSASGVRTKSTLPFSPQTIKTEEPIVNPFAPRPKIRESPAVRRSMPTGAAVATAAAAPRPSLQTPQPSARTSSAQTHGGSLGVYQHANSPLKKATSLGNLESVPHSPRNSREMAAMEQQTPRARQSSPTKGLPLDLSRSGSGHPERYPSRW